MVSAICNPSIGTDRESCFANLCPILENLYNVITGVLIDIGRICIVVTVESSAVVDPGIWPLKSKPLPVTQICVQHTLFSGSLTAAA